MSEPHNGEATVLVERGGDGVATLTINRPHRKNAATPATWRELNAAVIDLAADESVRVLVITGAEGNFCSGADVGTMTEGSGHPVAEMRRLGETCLALHRFPKPTIAKVDGIAAGAGLNLALACDLVVASDRARFSEIFAKRGLSIDFGGSWLLPRIVGLQKAKELVLFADIISADEAGRIGLVNRVVSVDELDAFVADWAARLAAGPPIALSLNKQLLDNAFSVTLEQAVDDEGRAQTINFSTADTKEAIIAFLQKREPEFRGR